MSIGFIMKGKKYDVIVLADSLQAAEEEVKKHKNEIEKYGMYETKEIKIVRPEGKGHKVSIADLVLELKGEGFFKLPRGSADIKKELAARGHHYPASSLTWPLQHLVRKREIGRIPDGKGWKYVNR